MDLGSDMKDSVASEGKKIPGKFLHIFMVYGEEKNSRKEEKRWVCVEFEEGNKRTETTETPRKSLTFFLLTQLY